MNSTRSRAILVATALLALGLSRPAWADLDAYVATGNGNFGSLDLTTGAYTQIGSLGLSFGETIFGLGFIGGELIGSDSNNPGSLYSINTATGAATLIGALSDGANVYSVDGGTTSGGAFIGVTQDSNSLLFAAQPTAPPNVLGALPLGFEADGLVAVDGSGSNIYLGEDVGAPSDTLHVLNASGLTSLGALGANAYSGAVVGSTLYTTDGQNIYNYTVSPTSLSGILGDTPITGLGEDAVDALALISVTSVPEPSTWALMLIGFAGLGVAGYRRSLKKAAAAAG